MIARVLCVQAVLFAAQLGAQAIQFQEAGRDLVRERFSRLPLKNPERANALRQLFAEVHCGGEYFHEQPVKGSKLPNLICTLPGSSEQTIIVSAHYDKVNDGGSQGAIDNWSSASLLPSLYQALAAQPRRFTMEFIGFTDEEKGLVGSRFFVKALSPEDRDRIVAVVNLDSIGMTSTKVWVSRADKELTNDIGLVAGTLKLPLGAVNVDLIGDSDSHPFAEKKLRVIDIHSITQDNLAVLHSGKDKASAIDWDAYYDTYRLAAGLLAFLDAKPPGSN